MKRVAFTRKTPPRRESTQWTGDRLPASRAPALRLVAPAPREIQPIEKENALQHLGYMALVRKLPCARCGAVGFSQFCHADEGKGERIKTDCRRGWPGCGPHDGQPGCHWFVGTSGRMPKADRREFERLAGARTREKVVGSGKWPKRLPLWIEP